MQLILKKENPVQDLRKPVDYSVVYDLAILGAGPAGLSAAIYALRKKLNVAVISKDIGGQVLSTWDLENYPGFLKIAGYDLIKKIEEQMVQFPVALEEGAFTQSIVKKDIFETSLSNGQILKSKTLIIATGKSYRQLDIPGEKEYTGKGVSYCATCDAPLFRNKIVAVAGGGNSAIESALELSKIAREVFLTVRKDALRADEILQEKLRNTPNIKILFQHRIKEIKGSQFLESALVENLKENKTIELKLDGVFVEIGLIPNTSFTSNPQIKLNSNQEIIINPANETNIQGLFACGDSTDIPEKQVIIAAGEGAKAALSAFRYLQYQK